MKFFREIYDNFVAIPDDIRERSTIIIFVFGFLYPFFIVSNLQEFSIFGLVGAVFITCMFLMVICGALGGMCNREICDKYSSELGQVLGSRWHFPDGKWRLFKRSPWNAKAYKEIERLVPYEVVSDPLYKLSQFWLSYTMFLHKVWIMMIIGIVVSVFFNALS